MPVPPAPGRPREQSRRNSFLFRDVNQRIYDVSATWGNGPEPVGFLCECGRSGCQEVLSLSIREYEAIRARPDRFVLVHGHDQPGVDAVVERSNGNVIVEKPAAGESRPATARLAS